MTTDLDGYAGQSIRLALRHHTQGMTALLIDELSVTNTSHETISDCTEPHVTVYPNPVSDMVTVAAEGFVECQLMDVMGRTVVRTNNPSFDISEIPSGVYLLQFSTVKGAAMRRVVKI